MPMNKSYFIRIKWPLAVFLIVMLTVLYLRPVPKVAPQSQVPPAIAAQAVQLTWPAGGQAALGAEGYGLLARSGASSPVPIGSTAKVITALAVLKQKPLAVGSQGPTITLNGRDVEAFNNYYSSNGSVTQVAAGEQISEYQALQSLMLPSSNNMADTLANWAFGGLANYTTFANQMVKNMGLSHTTIGDTNGFSDTTTSTADDMAKIALAAISNPVIAQIVDQQTAQIPVEGTIKNTNFLLGQDGIIGIKTGHTDKAGGNYIFATKQTIAGHQLTIVGAILSQAQLTDAISSAPPLINSTVTNFEPKIIIHKNQVLGVYKAPWGATANLVSAKDVNLQVWDGSDIKIINEPDSIKAPLKTGAAVGKVTVKSLNHTASSSLVLSNDLKAPSPLWRIFR
jgi:D-alanyl-D-alanine carboxypeptidase (penicillin-binding protein 5/6)